MPTTRLTVVSVAVAVAALILVVELLRRRRLREKYAVIWVLISVGTLVVSVFPTLLVGVSRLVGIQTPSNLLFFSSLLILFAVSLQLSGEVGLLEEQSRRLAEEVGALRMRVDALERRTPEPPARTDDAVRAPVARTSAASGSPGPSGSE